MFAGSAHGCCTDGQTPANGPEFEGCGEIPGQQCNVPKVEDNFSCSQGQTIKWWFDMKESGGCSRKWVCPETLQYSPNTFDTELECESTCVNPKVVEIRYSAQGDFTLTLLVIFMNLCKELLIRHEMPLGEQKV